MEVRRGNSLIRSLRWRSGGERFDPEVAVGVRDLELAVEVRRGPLLLGPGGEHCDLDLAVEVWQRKEKEGGRRQQAHVNFNNPDLTGGEKTPFGI